MPWWNAVQLLSPEGVLLLLGLGVLLVDLIWKREEWVLPLAWIGALGALASTALALGLGLNPHRAVALWEGIPEGHPARFLAGAMALDPFAFFFKGAVGIALALVLWMAADYIRDRSPYRAEFVGLMILAALAADLVASARDLLMIFLALEFLSISAYILVGFLRENDLAAEAAIKYFLYGGTASAVMLYGISLFFGATGGTDLGEVAAALAGADRTLVLAALTLVLVGFGFKLSFVPFHQWAPDTYQGAPTPVTAFLSTVSKAAGLAVTLRYLITVVGGYQADWSRLLLAISVFTMTLGNVVAIWQKDVKRLLGYSSIAHVGYMLIGFVALGPDFVGLRGVMVYLVAYVFTNLGAFAVVTAVEHTLGGTDVETYKGLIKKMPWAAAALVVFMMSLAGLPPTAGFVGKFLVFYAAVQEGYLALALIGVLNSVVSVYYYFNLVKTMFFEAPEAESVRMPATLAWGLGVATVAVLFLGLYPQPLIDWATKALLILGV